MQEILKHLLEKYHPKAVLLHGSRARNEACAYSDYDLVLITLTPIEAYPYAYKGAMLDLRIKPIETKIIENGEKIPSWPISILYDTDNIGQKICERTEQVYKKGPLPLSVQEWENRSNFTKRLIHKIEGRGQEVPLRHYYMSNFYVRVIRYWFEKQDKWTLSPYLALPLIQQQDPLFFQNLEKLWTKDYRAALYEIDQMLFSAFV